MGYDDYYADIPDAFGAGPEQILVDHRDRISSGLPVLDIGCGQGRNALYLAAEGHEVHAIDPSQVAVDVVAEAARARALMLTARCAGYADFLGEGPYAAVLVFGLLQILTRDE